MSVRLTLWVPKEKISLTWKFIHFGLSNFRDLGQQGKQRLLLLEGNVLPRIRNKQRGFRAEISMRLKTASIYVRPRPQIQPKGGRRRLKRRATGLRQTRRFGERGGVSQQGFVRYLGSARFKTITGPVSKKVPAWVINNFERGFLNKTSRANPIPREGYLFYLYVNYISTELKIEGWKGGRGGDKWKRRGLSRVDLDGSKGSVAQVFLGCLVLFFCS